MNHRHLRCLLNVCLVLAFCFAGALDTSAQTLVSISLTPGSVSIGSGLTQQLTATGTYSDGSTQDLTSSATWGSGSQTIVSVSSSGLAKAMAQGETTVQASVGSVDGTAQITVTATGLTAWWQFDEGSGTVAGDSTGNGYTGTLVNGITWVPGKIGDAISANGANQYVSLPAVNLSAATAVTWTAWINRTWTAASTTLLENSANFNSSTTGFGFFPDDASDCSGTPSIMTGVHGNVGYTLNCYGQPSSGVWHHIAVVYDNTKNGPNVISMYVDGVLQTPTSQPYTATNTNTFGSNPSYLFSRGGTSQYASGQIDDLRIYSGALTAAQIQQIYDEGFGSLTSLAVTPANISIGADGTQQYTATGTYSSGAAQNLTNSAIWASSNTSITTINSSGLASGVAVGTATIQATLGPASGSTGLTVTAPALESITVTPVNSSATIGGTLQFTATGYYNNGSTQNLTSQVTWSSSNTATASINGSGLATGGVSGITSISATYNSVSGSTNLTVTPQLTALSVTPTNASIATGAAQQYTATVTYANGTTQDVSGSVSWTSSSTSIATISIAGFAIGLSAGNTSIQASYGGLNSSVPLTVTSSGLVGWWQFDDGSGATAVDSSGNGETATLFNGVSWVAGQIGDAVSANGVNQYISTPAINLSTTKAITWAAWINRTYGSGSGTLVENSANFNSTTTGFGFFPDDSSDCGAASTMMTGVHGASGYTLNCYTQPSSGVWHHIAVVYDKSQAGTNVISLYIDGVLQTPKSQPYTVTNTDSFGSNQMYLFSRGGTTDFAAGEIDDFRLYNNALTATQIQQIYQEGQGTLTSISITPAYGSIAAGGTQQYTAIGTYSSGSTQNLTSSVTWTSSNSAAATAGATGLVTGVAPGTANIQATLGLVSGSTGLTVTAPSLQSITVAPANSSMSISSTLLFTATGNYNNGTTQNLTSQVTWSSSNTAAASINSSGLATGIASGATTITASYNSVQGSTGLTVTGQLSALTVGPASTSIGSGVTQQFTAIATYTNGTTQDVSGSVTWSSSNAAVATINSAGLALGVGAGSTSIQASLSGVSASASITVNGSGLVGWWKFNEGSGTTAADSSGSGANATLFNGVSWVAGETGTAVSTNGTNQYASVPAINLSSTNAVTWTAWINRTYGSGSGVLFENSSNFNSSTSGWGFFPDDSPDCGTFAPMMTGVHGNSGYTLNCYAQPSSGVWHHIAVVYNKSLTGTQAISLYVDGVLQTPVSQPYTATNTDSFGDNPTYLFSRGGTEDFSAGEVNDLRIYNSALSTAQIQQIYQQGFGTLVSLAVTPANGSVAAGSTQQFTATGTFSSGKTANLTNSVVWTSSNSGAATISSTGLAGGVSTGTTTIQAAYGAVTGSTGLTVAGTVLQSITVAPGNPQITTGGTQQFTAMGHYSDGSTQNITSAAIWSSSNTAVATIIGGGLATGVASGSSTILATSGSISGSTTLNVQAVLVSIAVAPANPTIAAGLTAQFTATGTYSDGSTQNLTNAVTWSSSASSVATINAAGLANCAAVGTTTIQAVYNSISSSTTLTVAAVSLVSIAITPADSQVPVNGTVQLVATGTYNNGTMQNLTSSVSFSSSNTSIATVTATGVAAGVTDGRVTVQATYGNLTASTSLFVTPAGLVGWWQFDDGSGTTAVDSSGNGYNATLNNGVTWVAGQIGDAVSANGVNQYAAIPSINLSNTTAVTWSAWINRTYGSVSDVFFEDSTNFNTTTGGFGFFPDDSTDCGTGSAMYAAVHGSSGYTANCYTQPTSGVWHHIAVVYDKSQAGPNVISLYIDGVLGTPIVQPSTTTNTDTFGNNPLYLFSRGGTQGFAAGEVDDLRLYNRALSAAEIGQIYSLGAINGNANLVSIAVTPANSAIPESGTQQYSATGVYSDGSTQNLTSAATWSSSNAAVASISGIGVATGVSYGSANIQATYGSVSGSTPVNVVPTPAHFVQWTSGDAGAASRSTTYLNQNATTGDMILVFSHWDNQAITATVTDQLGNTYIPIFQPTSAGSSALFQVWYAKNIVGGAPLAVTVTYSGTTASFSLVDAIEYSGFDTNSPLDVSASATGTGVFQSTGNMPTTTSSNEVIVGLFGYATYALPYLTGSGFTFRNYDASSLLEDKAVSDTGVYSATANSSVSTNWAAFVMGFKDAAPLPPGLAMSPTSVVAGATSTGTVVLNSPAPAGGAVVTLTSSNPSIVSVPASITIPANSTTGTFTATTSAVTFATQVTIAATYEALQTAPLTVVPTTMAQVASDDFNRANAATLGSNWTPLIGGAGTNGALQIAGGQIESAGAAPAIGKEMYYGGLNWGPDQYSDIQIVSAAGGGYEGPAVRMTSNDNHYTCLVYSVGSGNASVGIILDNAGTYTTLASTTTATVSNGDRVRCTVQGTTLTMTDQTTATTLLTATDSTIPSGYPGLVDSPGTAGIASYVMANWTSGVSAQPAALEQLASDNFNRPDALSLGDNWVVGSGHGPIQIVSDQIQPYPAGGPQPSKQHYIAYGPFPNDQWSELQVVAQNALGDVAAEVRASDSADNMYVCDVNLTGPAGTAEGRIDRVQNGTITFLAVDNQWISVSNGDYIRGQAQGSLISLIDVTTGTLLLSAYDTTFTSGYSGISMQSEGGNVSDHIAANWSGGALQ